MAKNESIIPALLSFERRISTTAGLFYGMEWDNESSVEKLKILHRISSCTKSSRGEKKPEETNVQGFDYCVLSDTQDTLKVDFNITFLPLNKESCTYSTLEFNKILNGILEGYKKDFGYKKLAHMYLTNILNGRWLFRNAKINSLSKLVLKQVSFNKVVKSWTFDENDFGKNKISTKSFDYTNDTMEEIEELISKVLSDEVENIRFEVSGYIFAGHGAMVYPSQVFLSEKPDDGNSKILYLLNDAAAFTSEKIGNAIRTIDVWYPNYDEIQQPVPIEPFAPSKLFKTAFRNDNKSDLFSLLDLLVKENKVLAENDMHFIIANMIRGGLFGEKSKEK